MKEITDLYDSIHMPAHLENKILNTAPAPRHTFRPAIAIAAMVLLLVGCSPQVQALVKTTFPELGMTIYEQEPSKPGEARGTIVHVDTELPTFARVEMGRLIFTGNGEEMDITDQITEAEPFYYTYQQDQYEITMIVGYDGSIENFGTYAFIKEDGAWFTGDGRNFLEMETEQAYPWVAIVWDTMDIPWPMPGAPVNEDHVVTNIVLND